MSVPTFAVIIPAFNAAPTIGRAIGSVLSQTFSAKEVIVIDDGSIDATGDEVGRFGPPVTYLHQPNAGVAAARNRGAALASADWLAFLDADDWYYPDRLLWHADFLQRDSHLDFLTGDYDYRRADGTLISRSMPLTDAGAALCRKAAGAREVVMEQNDLELFVENHFGDTHTLSVPRRTFNELGGYPVGIRVCEDVHLLIRLCARSARVGVVCEPMAAYVIHDASATRRDPLQSQEWTVQALRTLRDQLDDAPLAVRRGYKRCVRRARLNLAYASLRCGERTRAMKSVIASFVENPGLGEARDVFSIARGCIRMAGPPPFTPGRGEP